MLISFVFGLFMPAEWARVIATVCTLAAGHALVGFSLVLFWRSGTAGIRAHHKQIESIPEHSTSTLDVIRPEKERKTPSGSVSISMDHETQALYEYLSKKDNFEQLAEFLAGVFALENLLYLVRVIRFRNALLSVFGEAGEDKWCPKGNPWTDVFSMKFAYLADVCIDTEMSDEDVIHDKASEIYKQFICDDALQQINIAWEERASLDAFFAAKQKHETSEYLVVFNESVQEIYHVLGTIYRFQYKFSQRH
eukprot:CAMPEP_0197048562 /NCGR_PEP_ID=MMETSP1384-20130603/23892_1 /TAXON_ID=29189 /ORGANISM="Ammonia sp." /LENGTH=250 /DNA_ID=CAMNT_0042480717 /DNA_START=378 /DNA_END=1130 /DNA_ORIENTATION=+